MNLEEIAKNTHKGMVDNGFWQGIHDWKGRSIFSECVDTILAKLMLITTEVAEAVRKNDYVNFSEELADIIIRTADLAEAIGIDLDLEVQQKMEKNKLRPHRHSGKRA